MKERIIFKRGNGFKAVESDEAGLNEFDNAEMMKNIFSGVNFIGGAGEFKDNRVGTKVENISAESVSDIKNGIAGGIIGVDFKKSKASGDGVKCIEAFNG